MFSFRSLSCTFPWSDAEPVFIGLSEAHTVASNRDFGRIPSPRFVVSCTHC